MANHTQIAVTGNDATRASTTSSGTRQRRHRAGRPTAQIDGIGHHTLYTQVWDKAGNTSGVRQIPVDVTVTGDTTPPTDTSTTASTGWYTTPAVSFTVAATDAASDIDHVEWRIGGADGSIQHGPSGTTVTITGDGSHHIETPRAGRLGQLVALARADGQDRQRRPRRHERLPTGWTSTNAFTLSGTDATSGLQYIQYSVDGGTRQTVPSGTAIPALADGTHTISHRAVDNAGQVSDWVDSTVKIDTVLPANTTPAAPTGWQQSIALTLAGTDAASGFDHGEWRHGTTGRLADRRRLRDHRRHLHAPDARGRQGRQHLGAAQRDGQGRRHGAGQHDRGARRGLAAGHLHHERRAARTPPRAWPAWSGGSTRRPRRRRRRRR